mmetsp:Transcript_76522/g.194190  ORF Transcript_76522/g.194190 Transcript_76522/m.194190 type:complete len:199 (-) Transcript_76522:71-667(-)
MTMPQLSFADDVDMDVDTDFVGRGGGLHAQALLEIRAKHLAAAGLEGELGRDEEEEEDCDEIEDAGKDEGVVGDVGIDYSSMLEDVAFGAPVAEEKRLMDECVAGSGRTTNKARCEMLKSLARVDKRLLQNRLSHLAEGQYDLSCDVVRSFVEAAGNQAVSEGVSAAAAQRQAFSGGFQRRVAAGNAKQNARRTGMDE